MIIAHSSPDGTKLPQSLQDHTNGVLERAVQFSEGFDPYGITAVAALAHDLGKKTEEFQEYMRSENKKRGSVKHALGGTIVLNRSSDLRSKLAGIIVAGHHAGLPDAPRLFLEKIPNAQPYLRNLPSITHIEERHIQELLSANSSLPDEQQEGEVYFDLLVKMCFSSLVDADYLDTEEYMDQKRSEMRKQGSALTIDQLHEKLQDHMKQIMSQSTKSPLNIRRAEVYRSCINEGNIPGFFRSLNVPTGLGKTLAAMGFALEHAKHFKKNRIIVAIPFTSIIDQNADVYKNIFGVDSVLEHHSQVQFSEDENEEMSPSRLASENWDRPIVITTTVQLFDSLFSNKTSKCRKLHNIVNSVLVLDEFQQLPIGVLKPIFRLLKTLIAKFNVTVLVSSATPLSFDKPELFGNIEAPVEICPFNLKLFEGMKRVEYEKIENAVTTNELIQQMQDHQQLLCIVNTKRDALAIFNEMKELDNHVWETVYHLSTSMCAYHRKEVIQEIRTALKEMKPIAVVSTQLIEAGVDFDFPVVFRALAPIDSIVQAAGRCNREGKLGKGTLFLFDLVDGGLPPGHYRKGTNLAELIIKEDGVECLHQLDTYNKYFRGLYSFQGENGLDEYEITSLKPFNYEKVNELFKMIDQDTVSVLCRYYQNEDASEVIERLIVEKEFLPFLTKSWYRAAQLFSVNLYKNSRFFRGNQHLLKPITDGWYVWEGRYDLFTGITDSLKYNPDELVL